MLARRAILFLALLIAFQACPNSFAATAHRVVINEIFFDPPEKRPLEFIELHNPGSEPASLAGWSLARFVFPAEATIAAGGYLVLAQEPAAFQKEFGFKPFGPLPGRLSNRGEKLTLRDVTGQVIDKVNYGAGFPWPTAAAGAGSSLERIHPSLPGDEPGSWRSAGYPAVTRRAARVFIPAEDGHWRWRKGDTEASHPGSAWRTLSFAEDASWQTGRTSIGYGDDDDHTILADMRGGYTSVFLRHTFVVPKEDVPPAVLLRVRVDDGCVLWLNGHEIGRLHMPPGEPAAKGVAQSHEASAEFEELVVNGTAALLTPGTNLLAVQAFNASIESSDLTIDVELRTPEESSGRRRPSPGALNSVFATNAPPSIRDVEHHPEQPKANESVVVTARVTDPDGVLAVMLHLQTVEPGRYLRKADPEYEGQWRELPMRDDGRAGDRHAGDGVFTAVVPAELQAHRRLVRYRITATDGAGLGVRVPYPDDPCPNFGWFVYNGVPTWTGAAEPGRTPALDFSAKFLATLPVYHLLARTEDVARSQWDEAFNKKPFSGTLVYEGRVYDHIQFHNRGMASTYVAGKNKWGFKFNRAREFAPRDNGGQKYKHPWDNLTLNACASPWAQVNRGMAGMDEAVSFRAYQLAGVPSPNTHWVHFRVIDSAEEAPARSQYDGDLWGLYLAVQNPDGAWLRERGLPDGNTYSPETGRKHLAAGAPADGSDWNEFANASRTPQPDAWWRTHLDLPSYYSFHAINRVVANIDLRHGGNHCFYHRPDGRWAPIPWDLDMMFIPKTHWPGIIDQTLCLEVPALRREYENRAREILDLFCSDASPNGGQVGQLVDELAGVLRPAGHDRTWPELDRAMWNLHPRSRAQGQFYVTPFDDGRIGGNWRRTLASSDFTGFCKYILDFTTDSRPVKNYAPNDGDQQGYGYGFLWWESKDEAIPAKPIVRYTGPARFPAGQLLFQVSAPAAPFKITNSVVAVQWRAAQISAPGMAGYVPGQPRRYEMEQRWTSGPLAVPAGELRLPGEACAPGGTYRVRARYQDASGRWGHWSEPVQFVAQGR